MSDAAPGLLSAAMGMMGHRALAAGHTTQATRIAALLTSLILGPEPGVLFGTWMKGPIVRESAAISLLRLCSAAGGTPAPAAWLTTKTPSHWADVAPTHPCCDGHVPLFCAQALRRLRRGRGGAAANAVWATLEPVVSQLLF